ncbi:hypothetical protein EVG20_g11404, partial [Dentipellis fragilis]
NDMANLDINEALASVAPSGAVNVTAPREAATASGTDDVLARFALFNNPDAKSLSQTSSASNMQGAPASPPPVRQPDCSSEALPKTHDGHPDKAQGDHTRSGQSGQNVGACDDADSNSDDGNEPGGTDIGDVGQWRGRRPWSGRKWRQNMQYTNPDDYEQRYPPDEVFKTLDPNARVWKVYLDEAKMVDDDVMEAWRDTIDVLLVFAGLFSAVVTTFVVQSSQSLQPDYSQVSAMLLTELVGLQRAAANGISVNTVPVSAQNATSGFHVARSDQWVNGLWFVSLAFSLATALMAVLVKQWLQYYVSPISGTGKEKAHTRHFRFAGLEKWHVSGIVG